MARTIKMIDEDTLEMKDVVIDDDGEIGTEDLTPREAEELADLFLGALGCDPDEFGDAYRKYKTAEENFKKLYEPFKANIIKLHEQRPDLPKSVMAGGVKVTYVSPSTRTTIDSKKLKEEEPELAKKFTKTSSVSASVRLENA